jgi:hypothetical protein
MGFLGIYKAIYDYAPQAEGELQISDGDTLYVLEKSEEDDWWKAKKKASADEDDEPVGLIPNNYVEEVRRIPAVTSCAAHVTVVANLMLPYRRDLSAMPARSSSIRDRPTRSCRSPKMPSWPFLTHPTQIGSWSG